MKDIEQVNFGMKDIDFKIPEAPQDCVEDSGQKILIPLASRNYPCRSAACLGSLLIIAVVLAVVNLTANFRPLLRERRRILQRENRYSHSRRENMLSSELPYYNYHKPASYSSLWGEIQNTVCLRA
eukprot:GEMP01116362.1.p1 GENE.GEMP01116362.1~~GEMP01116362.1.p1  ORF type:complete len:126 (+),score=11.81 GEMP01116362.1:176-553(+)